MRASRLRRLGAWYFDFALWTTGTGMLGAIYGAADMPVWVSCLVFVPARLVIAWLGITPGAAILGIDEQGEVDEAVAARENWLTCATATIFFVSGINQLVHWAQNPSPVPVFGFWPQGGWLVTVDVVLGSAMLAAAVLLFRVLPLGWYLALGVVVVCTASTLVDWSNWDENIVMMAVYQRRGLQGLDVRPGEVEFMQAIIPEAFLVFSGVIALMLLATWRRFSACR